jgi:uncharacterized beta-barrel protein YwiB (DUF1934 family)
MRIGKVWVRVDSVHIGPDGREDRVSSFAAGQKGARGGKTYISYAEPAESGLGNTTTILAFGAGKLTLSRLGAVEQKLGFETGKAVSCPYKTPFMTAMLKAETQMLNIEENGGRVSIYIEYSLSVDGQPAGSVKLRILAGEDVALEH